MPSDNTIKGILEYAQTLKNVDPAILREGLEIARLHRKVEQVIENDLAARGLTARQVEILETLYHSPEGTVTPADLSEEVGLARSAMTSALDSLEKLGHTVRTPHPSDRRMIAISLTPAGLKLIGQWLPERYRKFCHVMGMLSARDRASLVRSYKLILDALVSELAESRK